MSTRKSIPIISALLSIVILMGVFSVPVNAAEIQFESDSLSSPDTIALDENNNKISDTLEKTGDTATYQIVVDHSVNPEFTVYAYTSGSGLGNCYIIIYENGARVGRIDLSAYYPQSAGVALTPKGFADISDSSGEIKTYTIEVKATTDNAGYTISVGTKADMAEHLGGPDNAATIGRNAQEVAVSQYAAGYLTLMNGEGDWYRYTPQNNDATYISNYVFGKYATAFEVYIADTKELIYQSNNDDVYDYSDAYNERTIVQNRFQLIPGVEYLIRNYTPTSIGVSDASTLYRVLVGLPSVHSELKSYKYPTSYTISPNKKTVLRINISGQSDLLRLNRGARLTLNAGSSLANASITECTFIAPNGKSFSATNGTVSVDSPIDLTDFLENRNNIPLNGLWTIEVKTNKTLNVHFVISGSFIRLNRNTVPTVP